LGPMCRVERRSRSSTSSGRSPSADSSSASPSLGSSSPCEVTSRFGGLSSPYRWRRASPPRGSRRPPLASPLRCPTGGAECAHELCAWSRGPPGPSWTRRQRLSHASVASLLDASPSGRYPYCATSGGYPVGLPTSGRASGTRTRPADRPEPVTSRCWRPRHNGPPPSSRTR
jgi:hypothetical protein